MSLELLQTYWWVVFSLVGALLGFMLFVQGGQTLLLEFSKDNKERLLLVNILGRKWELGFTTLVLFGGVAFAAFPKFYAVSFGGAYWLWTLVLISCVLQAISYEYRKKEGNLLGASVYEAFLFFNGFVLSAGVGVFVATLYSGNKYILNDMGTSVWQSPALGIESFYSVFNLLLGMTVFFLSRILALFYFYHHVYAQQENLKLKIEKKFFLNFALFLAPFLAWTGMLLTKEGYCVSSEGVTSVCSLKYFHNLIEMPAVAAILLLGVVVFLVGCVSFLLKKRAWPVWLSGIGAVFVYFAVLLNVGLNHTAFYPSVTRPEHSLTLANSSSSQYTLQAMFYVSLLVPFVLGYIVYVWSKMDSKKVTVDEIESDKNSY